MLLVGREPHHHPRTCEVIDEGLFLPQSLSRTRIPATTQLGRISLIFVNIHGLFHALLQSEYRVNSFIEYVLILAELFLQIVDLHYQLLILLVSSLEVGNQFFLIFLQSLHHILGLVELVHHSNFFLIQYCVDLVIFV